MRAAVLAALLGVAGACAFLADGALAPRHDATTGWTRAIAVARRASRLKALVPALRTREEAVARFDELARVGPSAARSHAHLLAGLLDVQNAAAQPDPRPGLALAAEELRRAIRLDRGNDDAAYDLELLLARSKQAGQPIQRPRPNQERKARPGGLAPPGTGY